MERKFLVNVQFFGKQFAGFQINGTANTVQLAIETALKKLFDSNIKIVGCSRTDSGVSAKEFYFTFVADTKLPADRVAYKLNRFLPSEIQCQQSSEVALNFNLRENIKSKTYAYCVYTGNHIMPLLNRFALFVEGDLDLRKMQIASKALVGKHNYKSFCNYNPDISTYDREVLDIKISKQENLLTFYFTANGFLYNMVRILAGTLIECGKGKMDACDIQNLFEVQDRGKNPAKTLSPKALTLFNVQFKK